MKRVAKPRFDPHSNEAYGALREGVHLSGYSFERACGKLKWLLQEDRWRSVGSGFDDVNAFLASIRLDNLKGVAEQRKEIAKLIKEKQPKASNRQIAKTLGVDESTVRADTAGNPAPSSKSASNINEPKSSPAGNPAPAIAGGAAAKLVEKMQFRAEQAEVRREERLINLAEIAKGNTALSTERRYPVIYADPPWRYENPPMGASSRSIENHYPTMTLEEICALPVTQLATDDALLYLWATAPKLTECLKVIEAWGFEYRTNIVWDKELIGTGYHARNQHELLLIAKRGEIPPPPAGQQPASIYRERRTEHSAKPTFFYEMIEAAYSQLPKIELFSRSPRAGWDAWGNQANAA
jgi:N6-adenosine-specific RNA methylase IME4